MVHVPIDLDEALIKPVRNCRVNSVIVWGKPDRTIHWFVTCIFDPAEPEIESRRLQGQCTTSSYRLRGIALMGNHIGFSIDMRQSEDQPAEFRGTMHVELRGEKLISSNCPVEVVVDFIKEATLGDILDIVTENRLEYYTFQPNSSGCLYWTQNLIDVLTRAGYVTHLWEKVDKAITKYRARGQPQQSRLPYPPVEGVFQFFVPRV